MVSPPSWKRTGCIEDQLKPMEGRPPRGQVTSQVARAVVGSPVKARRVRLALDDLHHDAGLGPEHAGERLLPLLPEGLDVLQGPPVVGEAGGAEPLAQHLGLAVVRRGLLDVDLPGHRVPLVDRGRGGARPRDDPRVAIGGVLLGGGREVVVGAGDERDEGCGGDCGAGDLHSWASSGLHGRGAACGDVISAGHPTLPAVHANDRLRRVGCQTAAELSRRARPCLRW